MFGALEEALGEGRLPGVMTFKTRCLRGFDHNRNFFVTGIRRLVTFYKIRFEKWRDYVQK
jgi:hypothetical protein